MAVVVVLVGLVAAVDRFTTRSSARDRRRFLALTGLIGVETVGLVVAAFSRLSLYIGGFGHTMLRTSTAWFLGWLALALGIVVIAVNRVGRDGDPSSGDWAMARAALFVTAAVWVVAFGLWNPEAFVAERNLDRGVAAAAEQSDRSRSVDDRYLLDELGPDAVPVMVHRIGDVDPDRRNHFRRSLCRLRPVSDDHWPMSWNRSLALAGAELEALGCPRP